MANRLKYLSICALLALGLGLPGLASPLLAQTTFDFETPYLVHPGIQTWDFSLVRDQGLYHAFYTAIPQHSPSPAYADTLWHATSPDLRRWDIVGAAVTIGPDPYDDVALWAPHVVFDEDSQRWAMLYTGVTTGMVQRACLAWSDDLYAWTKSANNPVFEPDSLTYHWAPTQAWSSFRDPFVYHDGSQWNMLSTAGLRLGGYPGYRRGIVHRATSPDLETWADAGVFYEHDGAVAKTRDLESPQYLVRNGWHHLFFVEQDLTISNHPTSHMVATDPLGWTMAERTVVDAGWAPEINRFDPEPEAEVFARLAKDQDPRDDSWFVTVKFDSVRFEDGGQTPVVMMADPLAETWPVRVGVSGGGAPTFGENGVLRNEPAQGMEGHGWFSSRENYGGPLFGVGQPGAALGDSATGRMESKPFTVAGGHLRLLLAGGYYPATCYVALLDAATDLELSRMTASSPTELQERFWNIGPWLGQSVRLAIVDDETRSGGWIAVDGIEERPGAPSGVVPTQTQGLRLEAWPNPFNPRTAIRFKMPRAGTYRVAVHDLAGRQVWQSPEASASDGENIRVVWNGRDQTGRTLASGTYFVQLLTGARPADTRKISLIR